MIFRFIFLILFFSLNLFSLEEMLEIKMESVKNIQSYFPNDVKEFDAFYKQALDSFKSSLEKIEAIDFKKRDFKNTVIPFDRALGLLKTQKATFEALSLVHPDPKRRSLAEKYYQSLEDAEIEMFSTGNELHLALITVYTNHITKKKKLSSEELYYLKLTMEEFTQYGATLDQNEKDQVLHLYKEINSLGKIFSKNIKEDTSSVWLSFEELDGLDESFIGQLKQNEGEEYQVTLDYPTLFYAIAHCNNEKSRKKLYLAFNNRAHPENVEVINNLTLKRIKLAKLLGYSNYSEMQIKRVMAKSPENVKSFLKDMVEKSREKEHSEFIEMTTDLPNEVQLTKNGKIKPWDHRYLLDHHAKKNFQVDQEKIREYFPFKTTVKGLITIYEKFFDINIEESSINNLWHEDVSLLTIKTRKETVLGYVLLDLFPREGKYSHACDCPIIPALNSSKQYASLSLVIANFTKPTQEKPSLLTHREALTFFHEFGHALHDVMGSTNLMLTCGTNVKLDFVEMPSQILEEWLWDKDILKMISSHYITKAPLPDELIEQMINARKSMLGAWVLRNCYLSLLSLQAFEDDQQRGVSKIAKDLHYELINHHEYCPESHFYLSFGHLDDYGPYYYGYLWSRVFALDVFETIKEQGLLNPKMGKKYIKEILLPGGSQDPEILLKNFLGREPSSQSFIKSYDL